MSARVALIFPGQGSQHIGMFAELAMLEGADRLIDAAEALSDLPLRHIADAGTPEQLADTRAAQPLLYLADWAAASRALAVGITPSALAGHSLGELAALAVAGVYSVEAGLELVIERARLMAATAAETPGGMAAVLGLDAQVIRTALDGLEGIWIANDNSPGQTVISGTPGGLEAATAALAEAGARRIVPLAVAGPFHSPLMNPAADRFADLIAATAFSDAAIPVLQNTDPTPASDAATIRLRLSSQMVSPVRWVETMDHLKASGVSMLLECGPGAVLTGLAKRVEGLEAFAIEQTDIEAFRTEANE